MNLRCSIFIRLLQAGCRASLRCSAIRQRVQLRRIAMAVMFDLKMPGAAGWIRRPLQLLRYRALAASASFLRPAQRLKAQRPQLSTVSMFKISRLEVSMHPASSDEATGKRANTSCDAVHACDHRSWYHRCGASGAQDARAPARGGRGPRARESGPWLQPGATRAVVPARPLSRSEQTSHLGITTARVSSTRPRTKQHTCSTNPYPYRDQGQAVPDPSSNH